jgi:polysaccharide biosynthesis protein PslH
VRILVLTDGFPYPLTSGRLREHHFLRQLHARHEVVLLSAVQPHHPREHLAAMRPWVSDVEVIETARLARGVASKLYGRTRAFLAGSHAHPMRGLVRRAADMHAFRPFDVILNAHLDAPIREALPDVPHVVDLCDAMALAAAGRLRHARLRTVPLAAVKLLEARRREARLVGAADRLLVASERDGRALFPDTGRPPWVSVLPNGVDTDYWRRSSDRLGTGTVVLSGAMVYPPNEDAAIRLIRSVMPIVHRTVPGARLRIVGRDPTHRLLDAALGLPWVTVTGFVPDVRPHLEAASVFAAPLRFGAGIQNKVLEAMAMALPVVASPMAAAGLEIEGSRPPLTVATTNAEMADAIVACLEAAARDPRPHDEARTWVGERFHWGRIGRRLEELLLDAVREGPGRARRPGGT